MVFFILKCILISQAVLLSQAGSEFTNETECNVHDPVSSQLLHFKKSVKTQHFITTKPGAPIGVKTAVETVGKYGPLLQDVEFLDQMSAFDRERIPERVVHAKGAGAFGYFETTHDITNICAAKLFEYVGKKTSVAVRFSTVMGQSGSADTLRDPRGFAIKLYTEEGNWDIVGLNSPTFFIRDPSIFSDFVHSRKYNPATHLLDKNMYWDFVTKRPETIRQELFISTDFGTPDGYRHMDGFGIHAFKFINESGDYIWVKFHFNTRQGLKTLSAKKAKSLTADDPDYATRDLYDAIANEKYPEWTFCIQVIAPEEVENLPFNPFDPTKEWPLEDFPLIPVGKLVLNRNPQNYFTDVEQLAFSPANFVPGVGPSFDKLLQGRLFSYSDTQRHRVGANFLQLPVNVPHCNVYNYQRDGPQAVNNNGGGSPNYYPNSFSGPKESDRARMLMNNAVEYVSGFIGRYDTGDDDNFTGCTRYYRSLQNDTKMTVAANIAETLAKTAPFIQNRATTLFSKVHPELASNVMKILKETPICS